jgi:hypothetical protein
VAIASASSASVTAKSNLPSRRSRVSSAAVATIVTSTFCSRR